MKIAEIAAMAPQWPPELHDEREIAEYIESMSSHYVNPEMIEEYFYGCHAVLRRVPVAQLIPGNPNSHIGNKKLQNKFAKMDAATMPPLVIWNNEIEDGHHRYRVAVARGDTEILCYVVID